MSVDTYLKGKAIDRYQAVTHHDLTLLVAPALYNQARRISLDVRTFLVWRSFRADVDPVDDHFHTPACDH